MRKIQTFRGATQADVTSLKNAWEAAHLEIEIIPPYRFEEHATGCWLYVPYQLKSDCPRCDGTGVEPLYDIVAAAVPPPLTSCMQCASGTPMP